MIKSGVKFIGLLSLSMLLVFGIHLFVLNFLEVPLFGNKIIAAYVFNFLLAVAIVLILTFLQNKAAGSLGFIFMAGSLFKFLLYFILFNSSFKEDGDVSRLEFASFFIPYSTALIIEVIFLSKTLNK